MLKCIDSVSVWLITLWIYTYIDTSSPRSLCCLCSCVVKKRLRESASPACWVTRVSPKYSINSSLLANGGLPRVAWIEALGRGTVSGLISLDLAMEIHLRIVLYDATWGDITRWLTTCWTNRLRIAHGCPSGALESKCSWRSISVFEISLGPSVVNHLSLIVCAILFDDSLSANTWRLTLEGVFLLAFFSVGVTMVVVFCCTGENKVECTLFRAVGPPFVRSCRPWTYLAYDHPMSSAAYKWRQKVVCVHTHGDKRMYPIINICNKPCGQ